MEFIRATSAAAGLTLLRTRRPDLVFLDLHLPDSTGGELLRSLWEDPTTRDIPSVVLTADATPGLMRRLKAAGAREYMTKPLDVGRILHLVDQFLHVK